MIGTSALGIGEKKCTQVKLTRTQQAHITETKKATQQDPGLVTLWRGRYRWAWILVPSLLAAMTPKFGRYESMDDVIYLLR